MAENWQEWISFRLDWTRLGVVVLMTMTMTMNMTLIILGDVCGYHSIEQIVFGFFTHQTNWCAIKNIRLNKSLSSHLTQWQCLDDQIFLASTSNQTSSILRLQQPLIWKKGESEKLLKDENASIIIRTLFIIIIVTFLLLKLMTKSRNKPTKLQWRTLHGFCSELQASSCNPYFVTAIQLLTYTFTFTLILTFTPNLC